MTTTKTKLTPEKLDDVLKETIEYGRKHLGLLYGEEFPAIAAIVQHSKGFKYIAVETAAGAISGVDPEELSKIQSRFTNPLDDRCQQEMMDFIAGLSMRRLAHIFYLGYKLGKEVGEQEALEHMVGGGSAGLPPEN